jgi:hypothetical protein
MQGRKAEIPLGLDAVNPQHTEAICLLLSSRQHRGLTDASFAAQHERAAHPTAPCGQERIRRPLLSLTPNKFDL